MPTYCAAHRGYILAAAAIAAAAVLSVAPATSDAQDQGRQFGALIDRVDRLQRDVQTLQQQVYNGRPPPPGAAASQSGSGISENAKYRADLEVRLDQIESQIAAVTGRNEELAHSLGELRQRLDKLQSDIDLRLTRLEQAQGITPGSAAAPGQPAPPPQASAAPAAPSGGTGIAHPGPGVPPHPLGTLPKSALPSSPPPPQPKAAGLPPGSSSQQYRYAIDLLLKDQDFAKAETAFKAFLAAHPKDRLAGNAQYWLGRVYFARSDFEKAAFAFAEGIEKYPKSPKAPDSLLDLGMSLARLGKTSQACTAFARLKDNFPKASESVKRRALSERHRLKCRS